jgi:transcriptional regulator with XRE-family HTH domain
MQLLSEWFRRGERPNKFTLAMGKLIKQAREEKEMSQEELAAKIYRSRPAVSEMENGKMEPDASTLVYLSNALDRPLLYFFPWFARRDTVDEGLSPEAQEVLRVFNRLDSPQLQRAAIQQLRALAAIEDDEV